MARQDASASASSGRRACALAIMLPLKVAAPMTRPRKPETSPTRRRVRARGSVQRTTIRHAATPPAPCWKATMAGIWIMVTRMRDHRADGAADEQRPASSAGSRMAWRYSTSANASSSAVGGGRVARSRTARGAEQRDANHQQHDDRGSMSIEAQLDMVNSTRDTETIRAAKQERPVWLPPHDWLSCRLRRPDGS